MIIEVPYWGYQSKKLPFDQIYHEHRNYYTIASFNYLQKKLNLKIIDLEMNIIMENLSEYFFQKVTRFIVHIKI